MPVQPFCTTISTCLSNAFLQGTFECNATCPYNNVRSLKHKRCSYANPRKDGHTCKKPSTPHDICKEKRESKSDTSDVQAAPETEHQLHTPPFYIQMQHKVLKLVNKERRALDLSELQLDPVLTMCARQHNWDQTFIIGTLSHVGSDGMKLKQRLDNLGYRCKYCSENIAYGQTSADHVMRSLMKSVGHRDNILNKSATHMGLFVEKNANGKTFWTQIFAQPKGGQGFVKHE